MPAPRIPSSPSRLDPLIRAGLLCLYPAVLAIVLLMAYGWGSNIIKLFNSSCGNSNYGCLIIRGVGVPLFPVGGVIGYF